MPRKKRGARASNNGQIPLWRRISIWRMVSIFFTLVIILILISFLGLFSLVLFGPVPMGNIAVIPIKGTITTGDGYGETSSTKVISWIKAAEENDEIKAIMLDINSGGGSAVASDEIAQAVLKAEKPTVAVIRDIGTSGAYWVASAADVIYANRMSITGSIGVIGSYLEFDGLLEDYNVTYRRLVAGKHKDMGSPLKEMTQEEEVLMQMALDEIHRFFIDSIVQNRNMTHEKVEEIATGRFIIGVEAYGLGLVDEMGTREDAIAFIEKDLNITADLAEYRMAASLSDILTSMSRNFGAGLASLGNDEISVRT